MLFHALLIELRTRLARCRQAEKATDGPLRARGYIPTLPPISKSRVYPRWPRERPYSRTKQPQFTPGTPGARNLQPTLPGVPGVERVSAWHEPRTIAEAAHAYSATLSLSKRSGRRRAHATPTPGAPVAPATRGSGLHRDAKPRSGPRTRWSRLRRRRASLARPRRRAVLRRPGSPSQLARSRSSRRRTSPHVPRARPP